MRKAQNQNICSNYKPLITAFACHEMQSAKEFELNPDFDSDSFLFAFEDTDMNDHQKEIVAQLWGIYTGKPMSKKEVAENMGVTYNRIRQVEICCLRHILRNRNRNTLIIEK